MGVGLVALGRGGVKPDRGGRSGFGARQIDRHRGAFANAAVDPDLAARLVREAENLAEAETGALADRLGGEERLERALDDVGRHAAAGVGDADLHIIAGAHVADFIGGKADIAGANGQ